MEKHTPGPWEIMRNRFDDTHSSDASILARTPIHKNPKYLCRVYGEGNLSTDVAERDANARLIAKAPEMYERLANLVHNIDRGAFELICKDCDDAPQPAILDEVRDLLAQIEGR